MGQKRSEPFVRALKNGY